MKLFTIKKQTYLYENRKIIGQFILAILFVAIGIWFFNHERSELGQVKNILESSKLPYLWLGITVTVIYIIMQGFMYKMSFASVNNKVPLAITILLYLKRNFISIFLPAGGVASLAFFSSEIEKKGISKTKIYFASSIYAFVGILSVVTVAIPIFIYALIGGLTGSGEFYALIAMIFMIVLLYLVYISIVKKGIIYKQHMSSN